MPARFEDPELVMLDALDVPTLRVYEILGHAVLNAA
jgi:hypothetical protein